MNQTNATVCNCNTPGQSVVQFSGDIITDTVGFQCSVFEFLTLQGKKKILEICHFIPKAKRLLLV